MTAVTLLSAAAPVGMGLFAAASGLYHSYKDHQETRRLLNFRQRHNIESMRTADVGILIDYRERQAC